MLSRQTTTGPLDLGHVCRLFFHALTGGAISCRPFGPALHFQEALRRYDEKLVAINLEYREDVLDACFEIIERFADRNDKPPESEAQPKTHRT